MHPTGTTIKKTRVELRIAPVFSAILRNEIMRISILTKGTKIFNFLINIFLILLFFTGLTLLFGFLFSIIESSKLLIGLAGFLSIIILLYVLNVMKINFHTSIDFDDDSFLQLEINTKKMLDDVKSQSDINFARNYLVTNNGKYEIDNQSVLYILNSKLDIESVRKHISPSFLNSNSDSLLEKVRSILSFVISIGGFK